MSVVCRFLGVFVWVLIVRDFCFGVVGYFVSLSFLWCSGELVLSWESLVVVRIMVLSFFESMCVRWELMLLWMLMIFVCGVFWCICVICCGELVLMELLDCSLCSGMLVWVSIMLWVFLCCGVVVIMSDFGMVVGRFLRECIRKLYFFVRRVLCRWVVKMFRLLILESDVWLVLFLLVIGMSLMWWLVMVLRVVVM